MSLLLLLLYRNVADTLQKVPPTGDKRQQHVANISGNKRKLPVWVAAILDYMIG